MGEGGGLHGGRVPLGCNSPKSTTSFLARLERTRFSAHGQRGKWRRTEPTEAKQRPNAKMAQPASRARRRGTRASERRTRTKSRRGVCRANAAGARENTKCSELEFHVSACPQASRKSRSPSTSTAQSERPVLFRRGVDGVSTGRETRQGEREKRGEKGAGDRGGAVDRRLHITLPWPPAVRAPFSVSSPPSRPCPGTLPPHCSSFAAEAKQDRLPATGQPPSRSDLMDDECTRQGGRIDGREINNVDGHTDRLSSP